MKRNVYHYSKPPLEQHLVLQEESVAHKGLLITGIYEVKQRRLQGEYNI